MSIPFNVSNTASSVALQGAGQSQSSNNSDNRIDFPTSSSPSTATLIGKRIKELKPEELTEKEVTLITYILIVISRVFTSIFMNQYKSIESLKKIALEDLSSLEEGKFEEIKTKLHDLFPPNRDAFVLELAKEFCACGQLDKAKELLELHSDGVQPKVLFLRAAIFEQKQQNDSSYEDKTKIRLKVGKVTLSDIKDLTLPEIEELAEEKVDLKKSMKNKRLGLIRAYNKITPGAVVKCISHMSLHCEGLFKDAEFVKSILAIAKETGNLKELLMAKDGYHYTPLRLAVEDGNLDSIKAILEAAKEIGILKEVLEAKDSQGWIPLMEAVNRSKTKVIELLLEAAREAGILKEQLETRDNQGNTPLMFAAWGGRVEAVDIFIKAAKEVGILKKQLETQNKGGQAVLMCRYCPRLEVINAILDAARDCGNLKRILEMKDKSGRTALITYSDRSGRENSFTPFLKVILEAVREVGILKEQLEIRDDEGKNALDKSIADYWEDPESARAILEASKEVGNLMEVLFSERKYKHAVEIMTKSEKLKPLLKDCFKA